MVKNYLKLAFRNFRKRKGHTFINILGLSIAIACCLFVAIYVLHELSYDTFVPKADRIYRVTQTSITPEKKEANATTPFPLGPTLTSEYPRLVEKNVRFFDVGEDQHTFVRRGDTTLAHDYNSYLESNFFFVDSTFFDVFGVKLIRGNPKTALDDPLSLVITKAKARTFFGDEDPIGQSIYFETSRMNMTVTGIMEPMPSNSHMNIDMVASSNSLFVYYSNPDRFKNNWFATNTYTYVLLKKGIEPAELSRQFPGFTDKYLSSVRDKEEKLEMGLQPLTSIHLHSDLNDEMQPNSSIFYVWLFSAAAILLLIIACVNFTNLATARAAERSREVGMRKTLGASRFQLFMQFMGESFVLAFFACLLAVILVLIGMPFFNDLLGAHLSFNPLQNYWLLLGIFGLFIIVGLLAGMYPALYLSGFSPGQILHGGTNRRGGSTLRKTLVVVQFAMTSVLIIGTTVVFLQLRHMQKKRLGYDKEHIVIMPILQNLIAWDFPDFKERVEAKSSVLSVTGTGKVLGSHMVDWWKIAPEGKGGKQGETNQALWVTYDFVDTYGLDVIAGRPFSKAHATDNEQALMINQQMVKKLGYKNPKDALGALFYYTTKSGEKKPMQVIGVVRDFNYGSIKKSIKPLVICLAGDQKTRLGVIKFAAAKIAPGRLDDGLNALNQVWADIDYIDPFNYTFQDQELKKTYEYEAKTRTVLTVFTILCITVTCLGLFGLASFTASQRTKEIGIRKTLGASIGGIVILLSKEYTRLVLIANVIAWPVIYLLASWWLQDFAYRIPLGWNMTFIFLVVAAASLLICLGTVSYQSIKAALVNPVESIRQE